MKENQLTCFACVKEIIKHPITKTEGIMVNGAMRVRERPKGSWMEEIKKDVMVLQLPTWPLRELNGRKRFSCSRP